MKKKVRNWLSIIIGGLPFCLMSQSVNIDTIFVIEQLHRDSLNVSYFKNNFDVKNEVLKSTSASIHQQGVNALATVINRGLPSKLFSVFYGGLRLNNINNSSYDLTLTPQFYFDQIAFESGSSIKTNPFNTMAGKMDLKRNFNGRNQTAIGYNFRHYNDHEIYVNSKFQHKKLTASIGANVIQQHNRFNFIRNTAKVAGENVPTKGYNLLADVNYCYSNRSKIDLGFWWQNYERVLPNIYHKLSDQRQQDRAHRTFLKYKYIHNNYEFRVGATYADEALIYTTTNLNSIAYTKAFLLSTSLLTDGNWLHSVGYKMDHANTNFFTSQKTRNDLYYSINKVLKKGNTSVDVTLIQHFIDGKFIPTTGELSLRKGKMFFEFTRNVNLPSFNDLYWSIGGNPNLKSESALQFTSGYSKKLTQTIHLRSNIYSYHISDFIQWLPTGNNFWAPENVQKIWSRGLELELTKIWNLQKYSIANEFKYTLSKSTYQDDSENRGSQLIYVPLHKLQNNLRLSTKRIQLTLNTLWLGKRYETTDNFSSLPSAMVFDLNMDFNVTIKDIECKLGLGLENIFNEKYEYVRLFPQPVQRFNVQTRIIF